MRGKIPTNLQETIDWLTLNSVKQGYRTLSTNFNSKHPAVKSIAMNCIIKGISAKCKQKKNVG